MRGRVFLMQFYDSFGNSLQNIFSHKMRSFLTLLGIIIGVFAVVTMFSTVYGLKNLINDNMEKMGWNNSLIIYPDTDGNSSTTHSSRHRRRFMYIHRGAKPLTFSDYQLLRKEIDHKYIYGMIEDYKSFIKNKTKQNVQIRGTNIDFFKSKTYSLLTGRYFSKYEEDKAKKVCIVGYLFADRYFADEKPLGEFITVGDNRFEIVGILAEDELNKEGMDFNSWQRKRDLRAVYIPLRTASCYFRNGEAVDYIYLQSKNDEAYPPMKTKVRQTMLAQHKMAHDFAFNDIGAFLLTITKEINEMMKKWNITLSAIASISLIVGGIGLFSTLLISINERMVEIGIRKSIGATETDIFLHFLLEAVILALMGALIGIFISTFLVKLISIALKFSFPVPIEGILLGLGFSILIGIFSGLYPAIKASKIDPIKAIYYAE